MPEQKSKSSGTRKHGRDKVKCAQYRAMHTREINKIKRVLRSCGQVFAEAWAREHNVMHVLMKLKASE